MPGVRSPGQNNDQLFGLEDAAFGLTSTGTIYAFLAPYAGYLISWGYQVTTTINDAGTTTLDVATADHDSAANLTSRDSVNIATGTAAANAIVERLLNFGNGVAVTAGQMILLRCTDAASVAGGAKMFALYRPAT